MIESYKVGFLPSLRYLCNYTQSVCVPDVLGALAVWRHTKKNKKRSNKKTADMDGLYATPLMTLTTDLGLSIRVFMFEYVRLVTTMSDFEKLSGRRPISKIPGKLSRKHATPAE